MLAVLLTHHQRHPGCVIAKSCESASFEKPVATVKGGIRHVGSASRSCTLRRLKRLKLAWMLLAAIVYTGMLIFLCETSD